MKWEMEVDQMEPVLEKIWDLHDNSATPFTRFLEPIFSIPSGLIIFAKLVMKHSFPKRQHRTFLLATVLIRTIKLDLCISKIYRAFRMQMQLRKARALTPSVPPLKISKTNLNSSIMYKHISRQKEMLQFLA